MSTATTRHTLGKAERLKGRDAVAALFTGGSQSVSAFPVRAVYRLVERVEGEPAVKVMVSVSKRHFKRAVKRNRAKRLMREAYRLDKQTLTEPLEAMQGRAMSLAFIWLSDNLHTQAEVKASVNLLLRRIAERL